MPLLLFFSVAANEFYGKSQAFKSLAKCLRFGGFFFLKNPGFVFLPRIFVSDTQSIERKHWVARLYLDVIVDPLSCQIYNLKAAWLLERDYFRMPPCGCLPYSI